MRSANSAGVFTGIFPTLDIAVRAHFRTSYGNKPYFFMLIAHDYILGIRLLELEKIVEISQVHMTM